MSPEGPDSSARDQEAWNTITRINSKIIELNRELEREKAALKRLNQALESEVERRSASEEALRRSAEIQNILLEIAESSQARYRALMEQSFEALAVVEVDSKEVVEVNRRFTELLGYSLPEDSPLYVGHFVVDSKSSVDPIYQTMQGRRCGVSAEARTVRHKNGLEVPVERTLAMIGIDGRECLLVSMRDISAERRRQEELLRDVEFARRVQSTLLPELPASPLVTIRTLYHPSHFVSGDTYFLEWRNEGKLLRGFLVDVSGHGLATALQSSSIGVLLQEAATVNLPLLGQIQRLNARAAKYFADDAYAAILGFELDWTRKELRYVGAGITQFYWNGTKIETPGMFVGMWENAEYEVSSLRVSEGDVFHFLTDGFTDVLSQPEHAGFWSPEGREFEADVAALDRLAGRGRMRDDASAVCLKILKL